jgi:hypothetical protein
MAIPLMPRATASWLIDHTTLTFEQIADFCGLHGLEVQTIADQEVNKQFASLDPIVSGQLTWEEIRRCEESELSRLKIQHSVADHTKPSKKKSKYTPLSKRQDRPDAIAWVLKHYAYLPDGVISKLLGTSRATIQSIRNKTHWNYSNLKPRDPVILGLCQQGELEECLHTNQPMPVEAKS